MMTKRNGSQETTPTPPSFYLALTGIVLFCLLIIACLMVLSFLGGLVLGQKYFSIP